MHRLLLLVVAVMLLVSCGNSKKQEQKYNQTNSEVQPMAPLVQDQAPAPVVVDLPPPVIELNFIPNPQYTPWTGTRVAQAKWNDNKGSNVLILSVKTQYYWPNAKPELKKYMESEEDLEAAELFAVHYLLPSDSPKWQIYWEHTDAKLSCCDVSLNYLPGSLQITDVDSNRILESSFSYYSAVGTQAIDFNYTGTLVMHVDSAPYIVNGMIGLTRNETNVHQPTKFSPGYNSLGNVYKTQMAQSWQYTLHIRDSLDNITKKMWE